MKEFDLISSRTEQLEAELQEIESRRSAIVEELSELATAARVLARLRNADLALGDVALPESHEPAAVDGSKPAGTPTVPQMILTVLSTAKGSGLRGLEPKHMRVKVAETWWPDVPNEVVNSIAWRMWKRGQLEKDGSLYMLPRTDEAADTRRHGASAASDQAASSDVVSPSVRP